MGKCLAFNFSDLSDIFLEGIITLLSLSEMSGIFYEEKLLAPSSVLETQISLSRGNWSREINWTPRECFRTLPLGDKFFDKYDRLYTINLQKNSLRKI